MESKSKKGGKLKLINYNTIKTIQEGFLKCALCTNMLDEPKCLDCLHKFCTKCLEKYIADRRTLPGQNFTCPNHCAQRTKLPREGVTGLKNDFYVQNMMSFIRTKSRKQSAEQVFSQNEPREESDYETPRYQAPLPPCPPPCEADTVRRMAANKKALDEINTQIALATHKLYLCQKSLEKFNTLGCHVLESIDRQEQLVINDIKKRSEAVRKRAMEIIESEQIKLQRTVEETRQHKQVLNSFLEGTKNRQGINLDSEMARVCRRQELEKPVSELSLNVERYSLKEPHYFHLLIQKTMFKPDGHVDLREVQLRQRDRNGPRVQSRHMPENEWYFADFDDDDYSDAQSDISQGGIRAPIGRVSTASTDSGYGDPGANLHV